MDGMLSQDEINALLNGMNVEESPAEAPSGDNPSSSTNYIDESLLSDIERDAIGEVANISMGTSATTLYSLVNQKVNITTPNVTLSNWEQLTKDYAAPCVFIEIKYTAGLTGANILILHENDVKIITDLMMGGDGTNTEGEISELHLSAIAEAMNQMMGSSATSLSSMMGKKIDISPPNAKKVDMADSADSSDIQSYMEGTFVKIAFRMQIGDLVDSTIIQVYPIEFAKNVYDIFMNSQDDVLAAAPSQPVPAPAPAAPAPAPALTPSSVDMAMPYGQTMPQGMPGQFGQPMPMPMQQPMMNMQNIQPAQFQAFTPEMMALIGQENIELIKDVPLEVTVELGRATKTIHEILDFAPGTIIELDKVAGEPVDVLVNGKFVAKGEVVVIEESFGVRVTEIIKD